MARGTVQPGDEGSTEELMSVIKQLLQGRALTFQELLETGARPNRIKSVIMRLQREGVRVVNLGSRYRALWFIPTETTVQYLRKNAVKDTSAPYGRKMDGTPAKKRGRPSKITPSSERTEPDLVFDTIRDRLLTLVNNPEHFRKFLEHKDTGETQVSK